MHSSILRRRFLYVFPDLQRNLRGYLIKSLLGGPWHRESEEFTCRLLDGGTAIMVMASHVASIHLPRPSATRAVNSPATAKNSFTDIGQSGSIASLYSVRRIVHFPFIYVSPINDSIVSHSQSVNTAM